VSSPIARSVSYFTSHSTAGLGAFYVNIDHIGMGCLLAFWRKRLHTVETYMRGNPPVRAAFRATTLPAIVC
jgi:hypothetical protein